MHSLTSVQGRSSGRSMGLCFATGLLFLLAACVPSTRVTLLPQADGRSSAVDVSTGQGSRQISQPYQVAVVGNTGALSLETTTAEQVQKTHGEWLLLTPLAAEFFLLEFEAGSADLTPGSREQLATIVRRAKDRRGGDIVVTGHTDRQGSLELNDQLSLKRARSVKELLVAEGFQADRIEAVGRGEREPKVPTDDEVVEPRNRRAEVLVR